MATITEQQPILVGLLLCLTVGTLVVSPLPPSAAASSGGYGATLAPRRPRGAVVVPPARGALAAAIAAHGPNTTFFVARGIHTGNGEMRPKAGSVFVGEAGAVLDGENTLVRCFRHDTGVIPYSPSAPRYVVTLRNLVIRNYMPPDQECAVMAESTGQGWSSVLSDPGDRNGWLLDHCTFEDNRAGGLCVGPACTARWCLARGNGQLGYKATGRRPRLLWCRSTANNADRRTNYFWEAGGIKCWNVKDLLIEGGEYDSNGGPGIWLDYTWDGNVIRDARFHDNYRAGVALEMTVGAEVTRCTFTHDDTDGIAGSIPAPFRPWDRSPKSGRDLWTGEIFLFNACAAGEFVHRTTHAVYRFAGKTRIHGNRIRGGSGGIVMLYQDRGSVDALGAQMAGSSNGPVAGLQGIVAEDNEITCATGYAGAVNVLANRDYKDAAGSFGPIAPALAQAQFQGAVYRRNRYAGTLTFCVPKAPLLSGTPTIWDWNARADVDLATWRALGKD